MWFGPPPLGMSRASSPRPEDRPCSCCSPRDDGGHDRAAGPAPDGPPARPVRGRGPQCQPARAVLRPRVRAGRHAAGVGLPRRRQRVRAAGARRAVRGRLAVLDGLHPVRQPVRHRRRRLPDRQAGGNSRHRRRGSQRLRRGRGVRGALRGLLPRRPADPDRSLPPGLAARRRGPAARSTSIWSASGSVPCCGRSRSPCRARPATCCGPSPCSSTPSDRRWPPCAASTLPLHIEHLPERFGLFVILVLGEAVGGVVRGIHEASWAASALLVGVTGFVIIGRAVVGLLRRRGRPERGPAGRARRDRGRPRQPSDDAVDERHDLFIYGHLPMTLGIVVAGAGIEELVLHPDEPLPSAYGWLLAGGVSLLPGRRRARGRRHLPELANGLALAPGRAPPAPGAGRAAPQRHDIHTGGGRRPRGVGHGRHLAGPPATDLIRRVPGGATQHDLRTS